jgi:hypothetical protein
MSTSDEPVPTGMNRPVGDGTGGGTAPPVRRGRFHPAVLLLVLPLVGTLVPEFYNRIAPSIGGMPFFYWYQMAWIPVSVVLTWIVYRATRSRP